MARSGTLALMLLAGVGAATPAIAQFDQIFRGSPLEAIFGGPPPRPPGDVPNRPQYPGQQDPRYVPGGLQQPGPPPGSRIRGEPLPPPPGSQRNVNLPPQAPAAPLPGQRVQPPQRGTPPPSNTAPQPGDEVVVEPSATKITNPTAVFSGLDKITGRIISFDVATNETVRFGALEVTPRACYSRPPTEAPNTDGFIEVDELTLQGELKRIFTGWMFAASPGLNAVEHPIYDVWLTDCKGGAAPAVAEAPPPPPAQQQRPQRAQQPGQPGQPQQQPRRATQQQQLPPPPGFR
jgi:hypothetical protein